MLLFWHKDVRATPVQDTLYIVLACSVFNTEMADAYVATNHQSVFGTCSQDEQFENITAADAITERSKSQQYVCVRV